VEVPGGAGWRCRWWFTLTSGCRRAAGGLQAGCRRVTSAAWYRAAHNLHAPRTTVLLDLLSAATSPLTVVLEWDGRARWSMRARAHTSACAHVELAQMWRWGACLFGTLRMCCVCLLLRGGIVVHLHASRDRKETRERLRGVRCACSCRGIAPIIYTANCVRGVWTYM